MQSRDGHRGGGGSSEGGGGGGGGVPFNSELDKLHMFADELLLEEPGSNEQQQQVENGVDVTRAPPPAYTASRVTMWRQRRTEATSGCVLEPNAATASANDAAVQPAPNE